MKKVDVREHDLVFVVSMSGRNPLSIEVALEAKERCKDCCGNIS